MNLKKQKKNLKKKPKKYFKKYIDVKKNWKRRQKKVK